MRVRAAMLLMLILVATVPAAAAAAPSNDDIGAAVAVTTVPFRSDQDASEATRAVDDPSTSGRDCFGNESHTLWFHFIAPESTTYLLDTAGSTYDTTVAVYTGERGALTLVECNGYFGGSSRGRLLLEAAAGDRFYVMVAATESSPPPGALSFMIEKSPVEPLEVAFSVDPAPGLLDNGEIELSGEVTCSRPATFGMDGYAEQASTHSYFFPPPFECGPDPRRFRAPTRMREGPEFTPGPAHVLIVGYGFDEYDRHIPEVDVQVEIGAGRIVYARSTGPRDSLTGTELFVMDPDGSDVIQLTDNGVEDNFASMSPDGRHIAFARDTRRGFDLYIMRSNGRRVTRLTRTDRDEVLPSWSPNGGSLAYSVTINTKTGWQSDLFKMRLGDRLVRRLTDTPRAREYAPEWAPDGTLLAFSRELLRSGRRGIGTIRPNGDGLTWLVRNPLSARGYADYAPTWSPDSQWVAFSREHGDDDPWVDTFKVRRDGSDVAPVTQLNDLSQLPTWGTDGRIAFQYRGGLAAVTADGSALRIVGETDTQQPYHWPDW